MTLVIAWTNKPEDPTALHLVSDSRLSGPGATTWDYATKLFRLHPTRDFFAYTGATLPALTLIAQATQFISASRVLRGPNAQADARVSAIQQQFSRCMLDFPKDWGGNDLCKVVLGTFDQRYGRFRLFQLELDNPTSRPGEVEFLPGQRWMCFGSGAAEANAALRERKNRNGVVKSRDMTEVLAQQIEDPDNVLVGGAPQGVSLNTDRHRPLVFSWPDKHGERYLYGQRLPATFRPSSARLVDRSMNDVG